MRHSGMFGKLSAALSAWNRQRLHARARRRMAERKARLASFGPRVFGLAVETEQGRFIVDPADSHVTARLIHTGRYGAAEVALATRFLGPAARCLVVGGHIGSIVVPLSRHCARMDVIEASPANHRLLALNIALNQCANVTATHCAANDVGGELEFLMSEDNSGGSKRVPDHEVGDYLYDRPQRIKVPARRLDDLFPDARFDLVFMDIEGSEYFALKGAQGVLARSQALIVEFIAHHIELVAGVDAEAFWAQLAPHFAVLEVPKTGAVFTGAAAIRAELARMIAAGESHENVVFRRG